MRKFWAFLWPALVVIVVVVGAWGFRHPDPDPDPPLAPYTWYESIYQALRLFTLNVDVPQGTSPPWYLHVAAFVAALVVVRTLVELFRKQLRARLVRSIPKPSLVVVGANERTAVLLAKREGRRGPVVVVDHSARALATVAAPGVWTLEADARTDASLGRILRKAKDIVVVTGDNARNSAITSAVLDVRPTPSGELFVEVEEPGLARTLEQGGQRVDVSTTTFSAAGLAAVAVLDEWGGIAGIATEPDQDDPPTITLFGTGALVDAVVLELHHRRRVQILEEPSTARVVPRVLLFGPDASDRCRRLATLMGTERDVLGLDPLDVDLDQVVDLDPPTVRHLARHPQPRVVLVLTPTDLDGGGLAITLARHLRRGPEIVLVTESVSTPFGDEISEQTRDSPTLAQVRVRRAPGTAYDLATLHAERMSDRLARALYEVDHPGGTPWSDLETGTPLEYRKYQRRAAAAVAVKLAPAAGTDSPPEGGRQALRRTALVSLDPPELDPLRALGFSEPIALARAGLHVDFRSLDALRRGGQEAPR